MRQISRREPPEKRRGQQHDAGIGGRLQLHLHLHHEAGVNDRAAHLYERLRADDAEQEHANRSYERSLPRGDDSIEQQPVSGSGQHAEQRDQQRGDEKEDVIGDRERPAHEIEHVARGQLASGQRAVEAQRLGIEQPRRSLSDGDFAPRRRIHVSIPACPLGQDRHGPAAPKVAQVDARRVAPPLAFQAHGPFHHARRAQRAFDSFHWVRHVGGDLGGLFPVERQNGVERAVGGRCVVERETTCAPRTRCGCGKAGVGIRKLCLVEPAALLDLL